jgi:FPC/CPF motif-containing protein YcgG
VSYHGLIQQRNAVLKELSSTAAQGVDPSPIAHLVHGTVKGWVLSEGFPCNGAKSAFNTDSYRLGIYDSFNSGDVGLLATDLKAYIGEYAATPVVRSKAKPGEWISLNRTFASFLACFKEEPVCDESTFEDRLWAILENLRKIDNDAVPSGFSTDPSDSNFAFCFGGEGFFVAAFHPGSWRWSRRFIFPLLVFNMHKQFDGLKQSGKFAQLRDTIRKQDDALQGSTNTLAADFGQQSEAPQYGMRVVPPGWVPPGYSGT